jgi:hypothetical protein
VQVRLDNNRCLLILYSRDEIRGKLTRVIHAVHVCHYGRVVDDFRLVSLQRLGHVVQEIVPYDDPTDQRAAPCLNGRPADAKFLAVALGDKTCRMLRLKIGSGVTLC